jgi:hypothetical protein
MKRFHSFRSSDAASEVRIKPPPTLMEMNDKVALAAMKHLSFLLRQNRRWLEQQAAGSIAAARAGLR